MAPVSNRLTRWGSFASVTNVGRLYSRVRFRDSREGETTAIPVSSVTGTYPDPAHANVKCTLRKPVTEERLLSRIERCLDEAARI